MGKVIAYQNTDKLCFCQIKFDSREKVLVSIASVPEPGIKVIKLLFGIVPYKTIWEFRMPTGEKDAHGKMSAMFTDAAATRLDHPLDAIIKKMLPCRSCNEAVRVLLQAEGKRACNT